MHGSNVMLKQNIMIILWSLDRRVPVANDATLYAARKRRYTVEKYKFERETVADPGIGVKGDPSSCLLYTSDAADE